MGLFLCLYVGLSKHADKYFEHLWIRLLRYAILIQRDCIACANKLLCWMQYKKNRQQIYVHIRQCLEKVSGLAFGMAVVFAVCDFAALTLFTSQHAL